MLRPVYEVLVPLTLSAAEEGKLIKCCAVVNTMEREIKLVGRGEERKPIDRSKVSKLALYALEDMVRSHVNGCALHLCPPQQVTTTNVGQLPTENYSSNPGPWSFS